MLIVCVWFIVSGYMFINVVVKVEFFLVFICVIGVGVFYVIVVLVFGGSVEYIVLWFK